MLRVCYEILKESNFQLFIAAVTKIRLSNILQLVCKKVIDSVSRFSDLLLTTPSFTSIAIFDYVTETLQTPFVQKVPVVPTDENVVMHPLTLLIVPTNFQLAPLCIERRRKSKKRKRTRRKKSRVC